MKVKTELFKELVNKSIKASSNNKLRPLTQFMCISAKDGELFLITTDGDNYLYVFDNTVKVKDDFYVVVMAEQFAKLISKMTSEYTELTVENHSLSVVGNGSYLIELPIDENGETVVYPDPYDKFVSAEHKDIVEGEISIADIQTVLESVKPSLSIEDAESVYNRYYVGDSIVATNHCKIAEFNKTLIDVNGVSAKFLMSNELMNLFDVIEDGPISYQIADDTMIFEADDCVIVGKESDGVDSFDIEAISDLLNAKFPSVCKINKQDLLNLLDRMSLFANKYDNNALNLTFEKEHILVTSKNTKSSETIEYKDSKKFKAFECIIDVPMFMQQVKAYASDVIELHYGREESIKLVDGNLIQIVALNESEE